MEDTVIDNSSSRQPGADGGAHHGEGGEHGEDDLEAYAGGGSLPDLPLPTSVIAVTPQMLDPMARRLVSLGGRRNMCPSRCMIESDSTSSTATSSNASPPM